MTELLVAFGTGALWFAPFLLLVGWAVRRWGLGPGRAVLVAYPLFFGAQVGLVKLLEALGVLTPSAMRMAYGVGVVLGLLAVVRSAGLKTPGTLPGSPPEEGPDTRLIRRIVLGTAGTVLAGLSLFALVVPVHVWDVLAYHMPMVASYVQNGSLDPWATQDLRQVFRVNAGELQLLNVALLARSDAWIALPNLLAFGVLLCGVRELAGLAFDRRALSWLAAGLVLTAPQIVVGAATAKNDLMFTAVLLGAFYWTIWAGLEGKRRGAGPSPTPALGLAALCGGLAAATKVMGLNVLGAVGLLALGLAWRRRIPWARVLGFGAVAGAVLLLLAGDVYWDNMLRTSIPVGIAPGETDFRFGPANLVEAFRYYVLDLSVLRLVTPQPFEHDFLHFGYLFPGLLVLGIVGAAGQLRERDDVLLGLTVLGGALFLSVIGVRHPIRWDQRFMIWMVPVATILALSVVRRAHIRYLVAGSGLVAGLALLHLALTLTLEADRLLPRSGRRLLATGTPARYVDVPNRRYRFRDDGFEVLAREAVATDSVLYVGTDDSWMYLAWGPRFTRHVEGVRDAGHAASQVTSGRFRFIVVEEEAEPPIRAAVRHAAVSAGYGILVEAEGRVVLGRSRMEGSSGLPGG